MHFLNSFNCFGDITGFLLLILIVFNQNAKADDPEGKDEIGKSTSQLVRLRKFQAATYNVTVAPGVKLNLVRIINPMLRNGYDRRKRPVLFIHGIISSSNYFLVNSIDARPKDWTNLDSSQMSLQELNEVLGTDPSANSLPFLLSNMGHDVWLLNRRPTVASQIASAISFAENSASLGVVQAIFSSIYELIPSLPSWQEQQQNQNSAASKNATTQTKSSYTIIDDISHITTKFLVDSISMNNAGSSTSNKGLFNNYWSFSLDEQAVIDLPIVIDFILSHNPYAEQVSTVSHSTGGAIMLMSLAEKPEFADKIGKVVLWAPAMDLGRSKDNNILIKTTTRFEPILRNFEGPIEPAVLVAVTELGLLGFCQTGQIEGESCNSMTDAFDGIGSDQLHSPTGFSLACGDVSGSHELAQLLQSIVKGKMHYYDFGSESRNNLAYGGIEAQEYNLRKIRSPSISIWQGNTDALVTRADTEQLIGNLEIPVDYRYIDGHGLKFDHSAFMLHHNVSTILNIPTLKFLEED